MILAAHTDAYVKRLAEAGTVSEKTAAHAELVKRGLAWSREQMVQSERQRRETERRQARERTQHGPGGFGWGGRF